jgi:hypothetical protein
MDANYSNGSSIYHGLTANLRKRFSNHYEMLASYTWSHSIDDSSDLQTLLLPQDNRNFKSEKANSLFDQRHRFVFSALVTSPEAWRAGDGLHKFMADFVVAPIVEISSGRPFNILSNQDTNNDQSNQTDRPNVASDGTLTVPAPFTAGSLGRNAGLTHRYMSFDMRLMRTIRLGERVKLNLIAEGFNLLNRFNEGAVSGFIDDVNAFKQRASNGAYYSRPTASFDPRQFQFGVKLNF